MYTRSERTVKRYTIKDAVDAARLRLREKHRVTQVCLDQIKHRQQSEPITLEQLNNIADDLYLDTLYWKGLF